MKKRFVLLAFAAVVVVGATGAFLTIRYWSRTICWAGHAPDRIAEYDPGDVVTSRLEDLPVSDYLGHPAVVLDLPVIGLCPTVPSGYRPLEIWLRVGDNRFMVYGRGGGP